MLAFLAISLAVICTPGQDTALTIRNTLAGGRANGLRTAAGVSTARVGAGSQQWPRRVRARVRCPQARRRRLPARAGTPGAPRRRRGRTLKPSATAGGHGFRQGLVSNLGNPKMAVFFTGLLPQFAEAFQTMLALGIVFAALTLAWLSRYARAHHALERPRVRRTLDAITGTALIAVGLRLAADQR